jgi:hypothetical protein
MLRQWVQEEIILPGEMFERLLRLRYTEADAIRITGVEVFKKDRKQKKEAAKQEAGDDPEGKKPAPRKNATPKKPPPPKASGGNEPPPQA